MIWFVRMIDCGSSKTTSSYSTVKYLIPRVLYHDMLQIQFDSLLEIQALSNLSTHASKPFLNHDTFSLPLLSHTNPVPLDHQSSPGVNSFRCFVKHISVYLSHPSCQLTLISQRTWIGTRPDAQKRELGLQGNEWVDQLLARIEYHIINCTQLWSTWEGTWRRKHREGGWKSGWQKQWREKGRR